MKVEHLGNRLGVFRESIYAVPLAAAYFTILVFILFLVAALIREDSVQHAVEIALEFALLSGLVIIPWFLVLWFTQPTRVFEHGLVACDKRGRSHATTWKAIESIERRRITGFNYICIVTRDSSERLQVPLWMPRFDEFRFIVIERTGADHVLARDLVAGG